MDPGPTAAPYWAARAAALTADVARCARGGPECGPVAGRRRLTASAPELHHPIQEPVRDLELGQLRPRLGVAAGRGDSHLVRGRAEPRAWLSHVVGDPRVHAFPGRVRCPRRHGSPNDRCDIAGVETVKVGTRTGLEPRNSRWPSSPGTRPEGPRRRRSRRHPPEQRIPPRPRRPTMATTAVPWVRWLYDHPRVDRRRGSPGIPPSPHLTSRSHTTFAPRYRRSDESSGASSLRVP